jgi:hypothetical protein
VDEICSKPLEKNYDLDKPLIDWLTDEVSMGMQISFLAIDIGAWIYDINKLLINLNIYATNVANPNAWKILKKKVKWQHYTGKNKYVPPRRSLKEHFRWKNRINSIGIGLAYGGIVISVAQMAVEKFWKTYSEEDYKKCYLN